ncbi:LysR substrate-binding domain-containing protein [Bosea sp. NBC_00550]|uniref:LysR substrate-binding domain-containing protein n=1 Tax=Bosea sp. NBC_00550 TaxID=2969621 RepID=UPI0022324D51|nr:LysR substrate-binding domain-containing protein [Bosea sp. NBC_00550]UZF92026.1 LysR substrate-binding domain-containing protein [Bosea sp. NBC_00550]
MAINLRHVELFRHIMRFGTLTQAAEMMSVSQPAASKMLYQLERGTGIILFQRTKGRLKPTRDGELYFAEVQRTWESVERLERMTKDIRELQFGRLNLGVMPMLAGTIVPPLLTRFCRKHEKTAVKLHSRSSDRIIEWAIAGQIDLGITEHSTPHPNVICRMIARIPNACVFPDGHRLASRERIRPEDLDGESFVSIGSADRRAAIEKVFEQAGILPRMFIDAPMANVACAMVASGAGIALVDEVNAQQFVGRGLVVRPFAPEIFSPVWHVRPNSLISSSLAEALMRDIEDEFERLGYRVDP